mmetsp:Transcript_10281/g.15940  ORF Transcript_10281/g.15940 Transcript_10281/m.15940 type:complete len:103 (+) Transcript_10281:39-347(+)
MSGNPKILSMGTRRFQLFIEFRTINDALLFSVDSLPVTESFAESTLGPVVLVPAVHSLLAGLEVFQLVSELLGDVLAGLDVLALKANVGTVEALDGLGVNDG